MNKCDICCVVLTEYLCCCKPHTFLYLLYRRCNAAQLVLVSLHRSLTMRSFASFFPGTGDGHGDANGLPILGGFERATKLSATLLRKLRSDSFSLASLLCTLKALTSVLSISPKNMRCYHFLLFLLTPYRPHSMSALSTPPINTL